VGEAGVRLYAAGQPGGARADRLLLQARLALDDDARLRVVRKMYALRFNEEAPARRSVDQLRGIEGARVRAIYKLLAQQHGVRWDGRHYDPSEWSSADVVNRCLSAATSALYGVTEAAILAAGYAPAIGFLHSGKPQSFVYDMADILKFETVVPEAFPRGGRGAAGQALGRPAGDRSGGRSPSAVSGRVPTQERAGATDPADRGSAVRWRIAPAGRSARSDADRI
jgi:CRISPR-associated protein Cas1